MTIFCDQHPVYFGIAGDVTERNRSSVIKNGHTCFHLYLRLWAVGDGDEVAVYTEKGILCGKTEVTEEGQYGQMAVYGDDLLTRDMVEGARTGENLIIKVNDKEVYLPEENVLIFGRDGETYRVNLWS